jgi:tetratricopeptide (TPR) repeat protein
MREIRAEGDIVLATRSRVVVALFIAVLAVGPVAFGQAPAKEDPASTEEFVTRGLMWARKGEIDKAIADYNEAIRLDPKVAPAFGLRGNAWYVKKEYDKAIADFNEAIRLDPKLALAFHNRGRIWKAKKEYDKAIADINEAIRLDPKLAMAFNSRAWLWATCPDARYRDGKKALESATHACELTEWMDAYKLDTLASAHAEVGEFSKAIEFQEKANTLYSDPTIRKGGEARLKLYREGKPYREE